MDNRYYASQPIQYNPEPIYEYAYPCDERSRMETNAIASSSGYSPYLPPLETTNYYNDRTNYTGNVNAGDDFKLKLQRKSVDPRVVTLLEMYRELFLEKEELFKRIFPGLHQDFVNLINQIGELPSPGKMERLRVQTMQRSLSVGSPRTPSRLGQDSPLRMERFKVRTLNLGGGPDSPLKLERFKVRTLNLGGGVQQGSQGQSSHPAR